MKKLSTETFHILRISVFGVVFLGFSILGMLLFLRPTESALENRKLQEFPTFTVESFLDGSYFSKISLWYSDTYPFREELLTAQSHIKELYGFHLDGIHGNPSTGDEIPTGGLEFEDESSSENIDETETSNEVETNESESKPEGDTGQSINTVWVEGNKGYPIFYFSLENTNSYLKTIHQASQKLQKLVDNVYVIVAPTSSAYLDEETIKKAEGSSQEKAIDYINNSLKDSPLTIVPIFDLLGEHTDEYIYFHTDHHWTALAAYYAYTAFAEAKGITPHNLSDFKTMTFDNFVGSLYSAGGELIPALKENPDTIVAYVPNGTNLIHIPIPNEGQEPFKWNIINDVSKYVSSQKYSTFAAGDNPYSYIHNPQITDGSSCLVIKESFANAFVPFLVDHYETVHIIDYRHYPDSIMDFVKDNDIQDVIFLNNTDAITSQGNVTKLEEKLK